MSHRFGLHESDPLYMRDREKEVQRTDDEVGCDQRV